MKYGVIEILPKEDVSKDVLTYLLQKGMNALQHTKCDVVGTSFNNCTVIMITIFSRFAYIARNLLII